MKRWVKFACFMGAVLAFPTLMEVARDSSAVPMRILFSVVGGLIYVAMLAGLNPRPWNLRRPKAMAWILAGSSIFGLGWMYGGFLSTWAMRSLARGLAMALAVGLITKATSSMRGADI